MAESENLDVDPRDLGELIAECAETDNWDQMQELFESNVFFVLHRPGQESDEIELALIDVEDELAIVSFTNAEFADSFQRELAEEIEDFEPLAILPIDGQTLLAGMFSDGGLLLNPGTEFEVYFPPGYFEYDEEYEEIEVEEFEVSDDPDGEDMRPELN
ncbi:MAG: hypothetical protein KDB03_11725 [Planctomycetales bacterium]|nr:hypothetical protein [Planctomycetales bacterium]